MIHFVTNACFKLKSPTCFDIALFLVYFVKCNKFSIRLKITKIISKKIQMTLVYFFKQVSFLISKHCFLSFFSCVCIARVLLFKQLLLYTRFLYKRPMSQLNSAYDAMLVSDSYIFFKGLYIFSLTLKRWRNCSFLYILRQEFMPYIFIFIS